MRAFLMGADDVRDADADGGWMDGWMDSVEMARFHIQMGMGPRVYIQVHPPPRYIYVIYFPMSKPTVMIVVEALNNLFSLHFDSDFMEYSIELPPFSLFCSTN